MGGSFNPPHYGHLDITKSLINKFSLDAVIWLISPNNPLKNKKDILPLDERLTLCEKLLKKNQKIHLSILENFLKSNYTYDTINLLNNTIGKNNKLLWIMGEDNLYNFDKFYKWKEVSKLVPILVISRYPTSFKTLLQKSSKELKGYYVESSYKNELFTKMLPKWTFWLTIKRNISSSEIRERIKK